MLLDSNIIIYSVDPPQAALRQFIGLHAPAVSAVSEIEVLGFHRITAADRASLEQFFRSAIILPLTDAVIKQAVALRQTRKMSLGDAIIAATAIVHGRTLVTRNVKDFAWISGLSVLDPLAGTP